MNFSVEMDKGSIFQEDVAANKSAVMFMTTLVQAAKDQKGFSIKTILAFWLVSVCLSKQVNRKVSSRCSQREQNADTLLSC